MRNSYLVTSIKNKKKEKRAKSQQMGKCYGFIYPTYLGPNGHYMNLPIRKVYNNKVHQFTEYRNPSTRTFVHSAWGCVSGTASE